MRTVVSLAVVLGLLFMLRYYLLRGVGGGVRRTAAQLRVREQIMLGPRARVVLLDVAERTYLLAVNDQALTITELKDFSSPAVQTAEPADPSFATHLQDIMTMLRQGGKR